jgi:glycosyltransferase involved in cell wall biosynthesis
MRPQQPHDADVTYIGFLLGHGGDALQMLGLAQGVADRGARVRIIVPAIDESVGFEQRCRLLGIPCERSDLVTASLDGSRQDLRSLVRLFRSVRSPIVHFHSGNSCLPRSAMIALELLRYRPSFATLHSPYETIEPTGSRARFWSTTARRRLRAVVSPSDHGTRFQLRCGIGPDTAVTIRNSIDVGAMTLGDDRLPRESIGAAPTDPIVLFSSRIDAQKRPVEAVQIFAGVADEFPAARLVFAGRGDASDAVAAEAARMDLSERVHLVGYQTNIADWLSSATVWILPTERENFSVAVLEALAAGCPILSTMCAGNDEVLVDGENALTFAVGDIGTATSKLRHLLVDDGLRLRLGKGAVATAEHYSVPHMVEQYVQLYNRNELVPARLRS